MKADVYLDGVKAGLLEKMSDGTYQFLYYPEYLNIRDASPVSLTLPLRTEPFASDYLFPFFAGLLSEGVNKDIQCRLLRIDENDDFGRLVATAGEDTIGAITVKKYWNEMPGLL